MKKEVSGGLLVAAILGGLLIVSAIAYFVFRGPGGENASAENKQMKQLMQDPVSQGKGSQQSMPPSGTGK